MSKITISTKEIKKLKKNPNVKQVSELAITELPNEKDHLLQVWDESEVEQGVS